MVANVRSVRIPTTKAAQLSRLKAARTALTAGSRRRLHCAVRKANIPHWSRFVDFRAVLKLFHNRRRAEGTLI